MKTVPITTGPELELARRAAAGDADAFESLYSEHVGRVFAICLRMCADRVRAHELAQDVFVRAWQKLGSFRGESAFSSWLHRLAVNVVIGEMRRGRKTLELIDDDLDPESQGYQAPTRDPGMTIDLERAIAALPAGARTALVLYAIEGYHYEEIADIMGITMGTVKAQIHRGRKLLGRWMS